MDLFKIAYFTFTVVLLVLSVRHYRQSRNRFFFWFAIAQLILLAQTLFGQNISLWLMAGYPFNPLYKTFLVSILPAIPQMFILYGFLRRSRTYRERED